MGDTSRVSPLFHHAHYTNPHLWVIVNAKARRIERISDKAVAKIELFTLFYLTHHLIYCILLTHHLNTRRE